MEENTLENQSNTEKKPLFPISTNPAKSATVNQYLDLVAANKLGSAIAMLQNEEVILLSKKDFDKLVGAIQRKDQEIEQADKEITELEEAISTLQQKGKAAESERLNLEEEIDILCTGLKDSIQLFSHFKPMLDMLRGWSEEQRRRGIGKSRASMIWFMTKKVPAIVDFSMNNDIIKNVQEDWQYFNWKKPLAVLKRRKVVSDDVLSVMDEQLNLPEPKDQALNDLTKDAKEN